MRCFVLLLFALIYQIRAADRGESNAVRLHFIPHSHCEPGAFKTFEEYYYDDVRQILDGVVAELQRNDSNLPPRKFVWAEVAFFERWWREKNTTVRNTVRSLVASKQLEFVGGGWVQNDDAVTHYNAIINQVTLGHDFLKRELNVKPTNAWQIDSYGVGSLAPILWANFSWNAQGCNTDFRALLINRIDYREKLTRSIDNQMSFSWGPSRTLADEAQMLTFILPNGYNIPLTSAANIGTQLLDDETIETLVASDMADLLDSLGSMFPEGKDANLFILWGGDFAYRNASVFFANTDRVISRINSNNPGDMSNDGKTYTAQYSTFDEFLFEFHDTICPRSVLGPDPGPNATDVVFSRQSSPLMDIETYAGEFLPYVDQAGNIYSGIYATRPDIKRLTRTAESLLRAAEQLHAIWVMQQYSTRSPLSAVTAAVNGGNLADPFLPILATARKSNALIQSHLAITAMVTDRVMDDYEERLLKAVDSCREIVANISTMLISRTPVWPPDPSDLLDVCTMYKGNMDCGISSPQGRTYPIVLYNTLSWRRNDVVHIAVPSPFVNVWDSEGNAVVAQLSSIWNSTLLSLNFEVTIPGLDHQTYFLEFLAHPLEPEAKTFRSKAKVFHNSATDIKSQEVMPEAAEQHRLGNNNEEPIYIENSQLRLTFSKRNGFLETIKMTGSFDDISSAGQLEPLKFMFLNHRLGGGGAFVFPNETSEAEWAWSICALCYLVGLGLGRLMRWKPFLCLKRLKYNPQPTKLAFGVAMGLGLAMAAFFAVVSDLNLEDLGITVAVLLGLALGVFIGLFHSFLIGSTLAVGFGLGVSVALTFLPEGMFEEIDSGSLMLFVRDGPVFAEVIQVFSARLSVVTRLYKTGAVVGEGWEVVYRMSVAENLNLVARVVTELQSGGVFYTDNGLEMRTRQYDGGESMAANYFPVITTAYLEEQSGQSPLRFTVVTGQTIAATSPSPGCLDLMLFNRADLDMDDSNGPPREHAHDKVRLFVPTWNLLHRPHAKPALRHKLAYQLNNPLVVMIGPPLGKAPGSINAWKKDNLDHTDNFLDAFPENLHLVSLLARENSSSSVSHRIAIRIGHMFEKDETTEWWSRPTQIDVTELFVDRRFSAVHERDLALGVLGDTPDPDGLVTMVPLQIKTYELELA